MYSPPGLHRPGHKNNPPTNTLTNQQIERPLTAYGVYTEGCKIRNRCLSEVVILLRAGSKRPGGKTTSIKMKVIENKSRMRDIPETRRLIKSPVIERLAFVCVCVCVLTAPNRSIRSCHPSHSMPCTCIDSPTEGSMILTTKTSDQTRQRGSVYVCTYLSNYNNRAIWPSLSS